MYLKCGESVHRSSVYHCKNLNLVEAEVNKAKLSDVEDRDNEETLELEAGKRDKLICII